MQTVNIAWPMLSRIVAAVLGGYAFTYAFTAALARLLPLQPADALIVATVLSFAVYTGAILWAFACRSATRGWAGLALGVPLALIGFWPQLLERLG
ncbi:iron transporter [Pseudomonas carassii]|uniref:Iron transporter n=1 Tax=Pseudomonas carassii TaxID=3115855 RepID=A0ABU7HDQ7_9PSED|nr:iron transporter [Pseudomonas sp. 137P]MEE1889082.1 iron transporter [Pseudomonas sp. 137P]